MVENTSHSKTQTPTKLLRSQKSKMKKESQSTRIENSFQKRKKSTPPKSNVILPFNDVESAEEGGHSEQNYLGSINDESIDPKAKIKFDNEETEYTSTEKKKFASHLKVCKAEWDEHHEIVTQPPQKLRFGIVEKLLKNEGDLLE